MIYPRRKHHVNKIPRPIVHRFRDRNSPVTEKSGKWKARYARAQKENEKNVTSVGCRSRTASKTAELNPRWTRNAEAYLASLITAVFIVRETVPKRNRDVNAHWLVLFFFSPCFSLFFSFSSHPAMGRRCSSNTNCIVRGRGEPPAAISAGVCNYCFTMKFITSPLAAKVLRPREKRTARPFFLFLFLPARTSKTFLINDN